MKKILLYQKVAAQRFCFLFMITFLFAFSGFGQQVIGEFPIMDGGMEGQTAGQMSSAGSSQNGTPQTTWTVSSQSNSAIREMIEDSTIARTGRFSSMNALSATATNVRLQSPSTVAPDTLMTNTDYTVQFFYKGNTDPGANLYGGTYLNNTSGGRTDDVTNVTPFAPGVWTKAYATRTSNTEFNASNWAVARIRTDSAGIYLDTLGFDDFVCYEGAYDDTPPSAPTPLTSDADYTVNGSNAEVAWNGSAGGVDGGGYVAVKYMSMPAADNDLNQNGIYAVGRTTNNGTGGLLGVVVYIGTDTFFTDTYSAGAYYKIYATDKAFNYSDEITLDEGIVGISEIASAAITVYPNPAKNTISIISPEINIESISIFSLDGKEVLQQNTIDGSSIDVSELSKGVYMLRMESIDGITTRKIVVE